MKFNLPVVIIAAVVAIKIFFYMRNKQEKRNYKLRKRFWKREKELIKH
jgi:uncharacterized membrane protein SpoIIM required for sporulation